MGIQAIHQLRKKSELFVKNLDREIEIIVSDNKDILNLNREQLEAGKGNDDADLKPNYSPAYALWKSKYYPQSFKGYPNLRLTGELHKRLTLRVKGGQYDITSPVPYTNWLVGWYKQRPFGIAPSNQQKAQNIPGEQLRDKWIKQVLNG